MQRIDLGEIENDEILEASGIASSRFNQNILWTHNDSGDENRIFAMDINGNHIGEFFLNNVKNLNVIFFATFSCFSDKISRKIVINVF